jgi:MFS family permease
MRGRHYSMGGMAKVGGLIFLLDAISAITMGKVSDRWIAAGASATRVRKTFLGAGQMGLGICLAAAAVVPDGLIVEVLGLACIFLGMAGGNCWAVTQTVAGPRVAGRWAGVQNFVGNFAGAVAPMLTGYLLGRTGEFYWPLVIAGLISMIGALCWLFVVGPLEPVDWAKQLKVSRFALDASPATDTARL